MWFAPFPGLNAAVFEKQTLENEYAKPLTHFSEIDTMIRGLHGLGKCGLPAGCMDTESNGNRKKITEKRRNTEWKK